MTGLKTDRAVTWHFFSTWPYFHQVVAVEVDTDRQGCLQQRQGGITVLHRQYASEAQVLQLRFIAPDQPGTMAIQLSQHLW
ncbi:hypothetical protein D3C75_1216680 [compost metagenome]